ncbi:MAG: response regulator [Amylibacter sp.]|nr:response regulator [Amylibacter sp.]
MKNLRLSTQIAISLFTVALLVGIAIGELERRYETKRLHASLQEQADLTVSLIGGLLIEAILVQETPVIDTAINEAVKRTPKLLAITIFDAYGKRLSNSSNPDHTVTQDTRKYSKNIFFEGEKIGSMDVIWSTTQGQLEIREDVNTARLNTFATLTVISILFMILVSRLAMQPLRIVHERMTHTINRNGIGSDQLPKYSSVEFLALNKSVTTLETALSERDQREKELRIASQKAAQASKAKSEFLANMSHEIRTPMNGVIGMAELILETELDQNQRIYAETISKSGSALLTIINDILDFSKIEAGKLELDPISFDLNRALEDVVALIAAKASQKDVEVTLRYDPELPCYYLGDVGRIRQVLTNIIGNAAKFTLSGYVLINVSGVKTSNGIQLRFDVEDTGIGIPQEKIDSIFNEFEQVEGTASRNFEGTGLGLAISTRLIKIMGGDISVTSKIGKGSVFTVLFTLPTTNDIPHDEDVEKVNFTGKTALIVDDLPVNLNILSERLRSWGIVCQTASSGNEALDCLKKHYAQGKQFDFAVLDFQMPGMHGGMLAEHIREDKIYDTLPIIMLSSVDQGIDLATKKRLRIEQTLLKPARAQILRNAIALALNMNVKSRPQNTPPASDKYGDVGMSQNPLNILVAEDNKTNQLVLKTMLKAIEPQLTIAQNGREAVDMFPDLKPDLILMDMSMPEMDGLEATQNIRNIEKSASLHRTPIIALTANAMKGDRQRCIDAGMDDYLSKPIRKDLLMKMIKTWSAANTNPGAENPITPGKNLASG